MSRIVTYKLAEAEPGSGDLNHRKITYSEKGGAPVLDLDPETIEALAADSLEDNSHTCPYASKLSQDDSTSRTYTEGAPTLHDGSAPRHLTPKAREDGRRVTMISKSPVSKPASYEHPKHPFAEREPWQAQKEALKEKFKEGWNPRKKLSPDALTGIRAIHAQFPEQYTTSVLAEKFEVSPEAIRRILKSRWTPKEDEALERQRRWFLRGQKVWSRYAELGLKPPVRWRKLGIGKKDGLAADGQTCLKADKNITMRSAVDTMPESSDTFVDSSASIAERIL
jgi:hypothetical protein